MSDGDLSSNLALEKINAQRITNVEADVREVRKDIAQLMRDLPHIVQDAVTQAVQVVNVGNSNGKNSNAYNTNNSNKENWKDLALLVTIIIALFGFFGQQINYSLSQTSKLEVVVSEHIKEAHEKNIELSALKEKFDLMHQAEKKVI